MLVGKYTALVAAILLVGRCSGESSTKAHATPKKGAALATYPGSQVLHQSSSSTQTYTEDEELQEALQGKGNHWTGQGQDGQLRPTQLPSYETQRQSFEAPRQQSGEQMEEAKALLATGGSDAPTILPPTKEEYKKALLRTTLVIISAVAFGLGTIVMKGRQAGLEFFAGYLVEQSLSIDNLFVFIMLFEYFKVPAEFQGRVLTWGIIGAVSMRAVMIVGGVAAIQRFRGVVLLFSGILLASAVKLLTEKEGEEEELGDNMIMKVSKFFVKSVDFYDGEKFFTKVDNVKRATPLLLCLVCIELSDFVFAVDSIPAVLGISKDSFIVYSSNVFAIAALRSVYTLVAHAVTDLPYLKPAVALVLGFVGLKMGAEFFHYHVGIGLSLSVVAGLLFGGTVLSIMENKRVAKLGLPTKKAHHHGGKH